MVRQSLHRAQLGIRQSLWVWINTRIGAIGCAVTAGVALSCTLAPLPIRAAEGASTPMTRRTFLQEVPSPRSSNSLGAGITTNYSAYCGSTGVPANSVITDRPLCDNTSIGGDGYDVPVSNNETALPILEIPPAEPMVLQQYNKVQLLPFIPQ